MATIQANLRRSPGDIEKLARHCAKAMIAFTLLHRRALTLADLHDYVARVPILAELNQRFLHLTPAAFAEWLVRDLERAGVARRENGALVPAIAA